MTTESETASPAEVVTEASGPADAATPGKCRRCECDLSSVPGRDYRQCRQCLGLVFPGRNPLEVDRIHPLGGVLTSPCPCCQEAQKTGELDGHRILFCEHCFGILMRNADFGDTVRSRRARRQDGSGESPQPIDTRQYERHVHCPNCRGRMETHPYYGPGNVVVDSCCDCCLIWLDHGELTRVERAEGRRGDDSSLPSGFVPTYSEPPKMLGSSLDSDGLTPLQMLADLIF